MNPINESGTLIYGVAHQHKPANDYTIGALRAADFMRLEEARLKLPRVKNAQGEEELEEMPAVRHSFEVLSARLEKLGEIPRSTLTPSFLTENLMWPDVELLLDACGRVDRRVRSFRQDRETAAKAGPGAGAQDGVDTAGAAPAAAG